MGRTKAIRTQPKEGIGHGDGPAGVPRSGRGLWAGSAAAEELGVEMQGQL